MEMLEMDLPHKERGYRNDDKPLLFYIFRHFIYNAS